MSTEEFLGSQFVDHILRDEDGALEHFGVKGMKWGQRKRESTGVTRKQNREMNREARNEFNTKKLNAVVDRINKAPDRDDVLVRTQRAWVDDYPTVITGGEFVAHLKKQGALDVRVTEIFATKSTRPEDQGAYVLNEDYIGKYKRQNFRKK